MYYYTARYYGVVSLGVLSNSQEIPRSCQLTELKVKVTGALGRPESHGVDDVILVPRDGAVVGHGEHRLYEEDEGGGEGGGRKY